MDELRINILIVDDHDILREGLAMLLQDEKDMQVVGTAENGHEGLRLARSLKPDIILMDIVMGGLNGLDTSRLILKSLPDARIIIVTMYSEKAFLNEATAIGAKGFFLKGSDSRKLIEAIRTVHKGGTYMDLLRVV